MNLYEYGIPGMALKPQNIGISAVQGEAIVEPWLKGTRLLAVFIAGAMAATDDITISVKRRRVGTSTWDVVYQNDGTTPLAFEASGDGETLENGYIFGELDLTRLKVNKDENGETYDYDAIAFFAANAVAQNVIVGGTYYIGDLYSRPPTTADSVQLILDQRNNSAD